MNSWAALFSLKATSASRTLSSSSGRRCRIAQAFAQICEDDFGPVGVTGCDPKRGGTEFLVGGSQQRRICSRRSGEESN